MFTMGQQRTCYFLGDAPQYLPTINIFQISKLRDFNQKEPTMLCNLVSLPPVYILYYGFGSLPICVEMTSLAEVGALWALFFLVYIYFCFFMAPFCISFPVFLKKTLEKHWNSRLKAFLRCTSSCLSMCVWTSQLKCLHRSVLVTSVPFCVFSFFWWSGDGPPGKRKIHAVFCLL